MPWNRHRKVDCQVCENHPRIDTEHDHYTKGRHLTEKQANK